MTEEYARKNLAQTAGELEYTISNYSSLAVNFEKVVGLVRVMRDHAFTIGELEEEDKTRVFELVRRAKLLAIAHADAGSYLERLELLEGDLKRVVA